MLKSLALRQDKNAATVDIKSKLTSVMKNANLKRIIKTQPILRETKDTEVLIDVLKNSALLKDQEDLSKGDFAELAAHVTLRECLKGEKVLDHGEQPTHFYFILHGQVSVKERNPLIDQWEWARGVYSRLLEWKSNVFDKRVEREMQT